MITPKDISVCSAPFVFFSPSLCSFGTLICSLPIKPVGGTWYSHLKVCVCLCVHMDECACRGIVKHCHYHMTNQILFLICGCLRWGLNATAFSFVHENRSDLLFTAASLIVHANAVNHSCVYSGASWGRLTHQADRCWLGLISVYVTWTLGFPKA